jgi:tRNA-splicing ligase RtcB (3'-phosphate/5'-hydroxy nucleic acid ligase)
MTQWIRETFEKVFKKSWEDMDMQTVYGICHNIVKLEEIKGKKYYVHRKGATRAFPDLPVIVAGTMGTASYICKGTKTALDKTFGSSCHGSGRAMSRNAALKKFQGEKVNEELKTKGIIGKAGNWKSFAEEAPDCYKDVEQVIDSVDKAGISPKVIKLQPMGVLKG